MCSFLYLRNFLLYCGPLTFCYAVNLNSESTRIMAKQTRRSHRGIQRGVQKHKIQCPPSDKDASLLENKLSTQNLNRIHALAENRWFYLVTICSKLCLIPLKPNVARRGNLSLLHFGRKFFTIPWLPLHWSHSTRPQDRCFSNCADHGGRQLENLHVRMLCINPINSSKRLHWVQR